MSGFLLGFGNKSASRFKTEMSPSLAYKVENSLKGEAS